MYRAYNIRNNKINWVCFVKSCKAKASSVFVNNHVSIKAVLIGIHNNDPNTADILRKRYFYKMKLVMEQTFSSTRSCISKVLTGAHDDVFIALRNPDSISKTLRRYRNRLINHGRF